MPSIRPTDCGGGATGARYLRAGVAAVSRYLPPPTRAAGSFVQHLGSWYAQAHPTEDFRRNFRRVAQAPFGAGGA